jgi:hypothetical protein
MQPISPKRPFNLVMKRQKNAVSRVRGRLVFVRSLAIRHPIYAATYANSCIARCKVAPSFFAPAAVFVLRAHAAKHLKSQRAYFVEEVAVIW